MANKGILQHYKPSAQIGIYALLAGGSVAVFSIIAMLIVQTAFGADAMQGGAWMSNLSDPNTLSSMKVMQFFNALGLFIVPSFVFAFLVSSDRLPYLSFNTKGKVLTYLLTPILIVLALPLINIMAEWNQAIDLPPFLDAVEEWMKNAEEQAKVMTQAFLQMNGLGDMFINIIIIALVAAVGEELMFRAVLQKLFTQATKNAHWGIWISAILFSALHGQFYGFFPRMLLGAMFGYLLLWSGSIWLPIIAHFVNNGFAVILSYLIQVGTISKEVENVGAEDGNWIFVFISFLLCVGILFAIYKVENKPSTISYSQ